MTIKIPEGMEITPEDIKRGEMQSLVTFEISKDGYTLAVKDVDGYPISTEEPEEVATEEVAAEPGVPTQEETVLDFVRGQMSNQSMQ